MAKTIKHHLKTFIVCIIVLFSTIKVSAFEEIKNMPSRNPYFTGRSSCLNAMQKALSKNATVYLTGYGGTGKTQIAKQYSHIHNKTYDLIWWFDAKDDLEIQYENLLAHLSNSKKFNKLLHININSIAPNVIIEFTNSLLSETPSKWLLIFDNVTNNTSIKLPKTKDLWHHVIITTREQHIHGNSTLNIGPFTNNEAALFLSKLLPKEKKEEINKLSKTLGNYPLALAQISNNILLHNKGISQYLKKHSIISMKTPTIHSIATQEYNNNYHEVLTFTLQEIEKTDKEAAKLLYMLTLLNINFKKEFLTDLFGDKTEEKIITLTKYGVIQAPYYEQSQVITIHDIIKEEAINRLNSKPKDYQTEIFQKLKKYFKKFYTEKTLQQLYELDITNNHIAATYTFLNLALQNNSVDEDVANIIITVIKLNNMLYNRRANYVFFHEICEKIFNTTLKNLSPRKKALLYSCIIVSSTIVESEEKITKIKKEIFHLVTILEKEKDYEALFYVYIRISMYHISTGDFSEAKKYLEMAQKYTTYADSQFSLILFWYCNAWLSCEARDVSFGTIALSNFLRLSNKLLTPLGRLFARDIKIKFLIIKGHFELAEKELNETIKEALIYSNNTSSIILAQLEYTKTMLYFQNRNRKQAKIQCLNAIKILSAALGKDLNDQPQAHVHAILGKIYEDDNKFNEAIEEYMKAMKYYKNMSRGKVNIFYGYGELLSNLSLFYYKQHNYTEAKHYFQKLTQNFSLDNNIIENLVKTLPSDFIDKINSAKI